METIKYAFQFDTKRVVHISQAKRKAGNLYVCGACNDSLIPVKGGERDWHYRHKVDTNCGGAPMTMIHEMAEQIVLENHRIVAPGKRGYLNYCEAKKEAPVDHFRPDIRLNVSEEWVYVEIRVSSDCSAEKLKYFKDNKKKSFEIDLFRIDRAIEPDKLKRLVLEELGNRRVLYWPEEVPEIVPELHPAPGADPLELLIKWLLIIAGIIVGQMFLSSLIEQITRPKKRGFAYAQKRRRRW